VDLLIGCAFLPGALDVVELDGRAAEPHLLGDVEQCFQFF
jgi:hypothetical protein